MENLALVGRQYQLRLLLYQGVQSKTPVPVSVVFNDTPRQGRISVSGASTLDDLSPQLHDAWMADPVLSRLEHSHAYYVAELRQRVEEMAAAATRDVGVGNR